jgi:hypothetical protein
MKKRLNHESHELHEWDFRLRWARLKYVQDAQEPDIARIHRDPRRRASYRPTWPDRETPCKNVQHATSSRLAFVFPMNRSIRHGGDRLVCQVSGPLAASHFVCPLGPGFDRLSLHGHVDVASAKRTDVANPVEGHQTGNGRSPLSSFDGLSLSAAWTLLAGPPRLGLGAQADRHFRSWLLLASTSRLCEGLDTKNKRRILAGKISGKPQT